MPTLFKRKRSKYWWIDALAPNGKRIRVSTKTQDKKTAETILKVFESKIAVAKLFKNIKSINPDEFTLSTNSKGTNEWIIKRWNSFNTREKQAVIFSFFEGKCHYCGTNVHIPEHRLKHADSKRCVMDHKFPRIAGGSDNFDNIVLSCHECNIKKFDRSHEDFIYELANKSIAEVIPNIQK